jgi:hypothetical protein
MSDDQRQPKRANFKGQPGIHPPNERATPSTNVRSADNTTPTDQRQPAESPSRPNDRPTPLFNIPKPFSGRPESSGDVPSPQRSTGSIIDETVIVDPFKRLGEATRGSDDAEADESLGSKNEDPNRTTAGWIVGASALALVALACWYYFGEKHPIKLTAVEPPPPAERGEQLVADPFWVKGEVIGELKANDATDGIYICAVYVEDEIYMIRNIKPAHLKAGKPFDFGFKKTGQKYTAAFVKNEGKHEYRKISNTISFTH